MGKQTKLWLITAAALVLVGCIVFCGIMMALNWDFSKLSTVKYETITYDLSNSYANISIVTDTADIVFVPCDSDVPTVVCHQQQNMPHTVSVQDGNLEIKINDTRKWYEYIGINFGSPKITVSIPRGDYGALSVKASTGDVEIPNDFRFESIDITESTGDVTNYASALGFIKIKTSTGNICTQNISADTLDLSVTTGSVTVTGAVCQGDMHITVSTGKTQISDSKCKNVISTGDTGNISLKNVIATEKFSIERSTGDVTFDNSDAAEIFTQTDTGDVTGNLLSTKIYIVDNKTGKVIVPPSISGGKCQITTNTGDIEFSSN